MRAPIAFSLCLSLAVPAWAQDIWATPDQLDTSSRAPTATSAPQMPREAPVPEAVPVEIETYEARLLRGLRQIVARDFDGAIVTLRKAAEREPGAPGAFCHLGEARLQKGVFDEARASYETCLRFASLTESAHYVSVAYIGLARLAERAGSELRERRDAWARARENITEPLAKQLAATRLAIYDAALVREATYDGVRKRIVEREVKREAALQGTSTP